MIIILLAIKSHVIADIPVHLIGQFREKVIKNFLSLQKDKHIQNLIIKKDIDSKTQDFLILQLKKIVKEIMASEN